MNTPGLAYWHHQVLINDAYPEEAIQKMLAMPEFEHACAAAARGAVALTNSNAAIARAFRDSAKSFYAMFVMILDARGPVTLASLQALAAELGFASRGRAAAMMMYLRIIGYLERCTHQPNGRSVGFKASDKLIAVHDEFMRNELTAAARIEPDARPIVERLSDTEFRRAYVRQMGLGVVRVVRGPRSPTSLFADRDAGLATLYQIALSGSGYPAREPVQLSLSELARKQGVSRSHVSRLLRDAAAAGLMRQERNGAWTILEPLREALMRLHALSFVGHAAFAYGAVQSLREQTNELNGGASPVSHSIMAGKEKADGSRIDAKGTA